jgi:hypothetical protein
MASLIGNDGIIDNLYLQIKLVFLPKSLLCKFFAVRN